jgi:hypothetical protein
MFPVGGASPLRSSKVCFERMGEDWFVTMFNTVFCMGLSQKRAEPVVKALVTRFGIDAKRLTPRDLAFLAPLASNSTDDVARRTGVWSWSWIEVAQSGAAASRPQPIDRSQSMQGLLLRFCATPL